MRLGKFDAHASRGGGVGQPGAQFLDRVMANLIGLLVLLLLHLKVQIGQFRSELAGDLWIGLDRRHRGRRAARGAQVGRIAHHSLHHTGYLGGDIGTLGSEDHSRELWREA